MNIMNTSYQILRLTGYASGLLGLGFYLFGQNAEGGATLWTRLAGGLLVLMFVSMLASYVVYALIQMKRKHR